MKFLIQKIDKEIRHDFSFHLLESLHFRKWRDPKAKDVVKYLNYDPTVQHDPNDYQSVLQSLVIPFKESHKDYIPIGSVQFVTEYLQYFYGLTPKPINIPTELIDFANRRVWTCNIATIPCFIDGVYFIKSATKIKGYSGLITKRGDDIGSNIPIDDYQISTYVDIESEWRAFVYQDKLVGLQNYAGDFTIYPDVEYIKEMIKSYKSAPIAYTLDVGVYTPSNPSTFVIECHDFFSCGLYGFADYRILPNMFSQWFIQYTKNNLK